MRVLLGLLLITSAVFPDPGIMIDVDIFIEQPGGYDPGGLVCK